MLVTPPAQAAAPVFVAKAFAVLNRGAATREIARAAFFRLLTNRHPVIFSVLWPGVQLRLVERLVRNEFLPITLTFAHVLLNALS